MQIEISLAISAGAAESDALQLLTLEVDAQPSIETLGLGLADAKALLARMQSQIVTHQVELISTSQRRCDGCGLNRAIKDYHRRSLPQPVWQCCREGAALAAMRMSLQHRPKRTAGPALDLGGVGVRPKPLGRHDSVCQVLGVAGAVDAGGRSQRHEHGATAHAGRW